MKTTILKIHRYYRLKEDESYFERWRVYCNEEEIGRILLSHLFGIRSVKFVSKGTNNKRNEIASFSTDSIENLTGKLLSNIPAFVNTEIKVQYTSEENL